MDKIKFLELWIGYFRTLDSRGQSERSAHDNSYHFNSTLIASKADPRSSQGVSHIFKYSSKPLGSSLLCIQTTSPFRMLFNSHLCFSLALSFLPISQAWASLVAQSVKNLPTVQETQVWFLDQKDPLEKEMATNSSILAWGIPWTEEPGRLQSTGSQKSWTGLIE